MIQFNEKHDDFENSYYQPKTLSTKNVYEMKNGFYF